MSWVWPRFFGADISSIHSGLNISEYEFVPSSIATTFSCKGIFQTIFATFLYNSITFPRISEEIRSLWQGTLLYDYTLKWALHDMAKKAQERLLAYFAALAKIPYWHPGHIPIRRRKLGRQRLWHCRCRHRLCSFFEESENKVHLSRP